MSWSVIVFQIMKNVFLTSLSRPRSPTIPHWCKCSVEMWFSKLNGIFLGYSVPANTISDSEDNFFSWWPYRCSVEQENTGANFHHHRPRDCNSTSITTFTRTVTIVFVWWCCRYVTIWTLRATTFILYCIGVPTPGSYTYTVQDKVYLRQVVSVFKMKLETFLGYSTM